MVSVLLLVFRFGVSRADFGVVRKSHKSDVKGDDSSLTKELLGKQSKICGGYFY